MATHTSTWEVEAGELLWVPGQSEEWCETSTGPCFDLRALAITDYSYFFHECHWVIRTECITPITAWDTQKPINGRHWNKGSISSTGEASSSTNIQHAYNQQHHLQVNNHHRQQEDCSQNDWTNPAFCPSARGKLLLLGLFGPSLDGICNYESQKFLILNLPSLSPRVV